MKIKQEKYSIKMTEKKNGKISITDAKKMNKRDKKYIIDEWNVVLVGENQGKSNRNVKNNVR